MEAPPPPPLRQPPRLHEEAIVEILSRLPVKPLLRFRCVSPSWRSIISDPNFVKLHLERSPRNANTILDVEEEDDEGMYARAVPYSNRCLFDFPPSPIPVADSYSLADYYFVLGSCNGLVCVAAPAPFFGTEKVEDASDQAWFWFWNPATRMNPRPKSTLPGLVNSNFGFGYDKSTDSYRVVAITDDTADSGRYKVKVHTMGVSGWREIESFPALPLLGNWRELGYWRNENDGVYLRGTLNWFALSNFGLGNKWGDATLDRLHIVSLDLRDETYNRLLLPAGLDELPRCKPVLGVLLDYMCLSHDYKGTHFVLWRMTEFGVNESWTQLVNVSYVHLQAHFPSVKEYPLMPLCISDDGQVVVLASNEDGKVILYNCRDSTVEHAAIPDNKRWTHPKDYIQSLVLPLAFESPDSSP